MRKQLRLLAAAGLWAGFIPLASGEGGAPAPAAPSAPKTQAQAGSAEPPSVETYYTVDKLRDPFLKTQVAGVSKPKVGEEKEAVIEEFSIHNLALKAMMKDAASDYAVFSESPSGVVYVLRKGRLFDLKGKALPGVTGSIEIKKKSATLATPDKDIQIFRLGEDGKEKDSASGGPVPAAAQATGPAKAGGG